MDVPLHCYWPEECGFVSGSKVSEISHVPGNMLTYLPLKSLGKLLVDFPHQKSPQIAQVLTVSSFRYNSTLNSHEERLMVTEDHKGGVGRLT